VRRLQARRQGADILPRGAADVARCEPVYETFAGWNESTVGIKTWDALPANARAYLSRVRKWPACRST
jgi:adenylosuccinate synthase